MTDLIKKELQAYRLCSEKDKYRNALQSRKDGLELRIEKMRQEVEDIKIVLGTIKR